MSDWEEMRKAAQKVQTIMPGHGVMLNAASVLAILADRETLKKERDQAREELSTWRSVFPDIAPDSLLPDRSKVEARVSALADLLEKSRAVIGFAAIRWRSNVRYGSLAETEALRNADIILAEIEAALASETTKGADQPEGQPARIEEARG